ncbi:MAG: class I SAM-dependent methyltransferase, partial [Woeseia sp.]
MLSPAMETPDTETPRQREVQRRFDRCADDSDAAEFLFAASRTGLLDRLQPMQLEVERVLILGAGTGALNRELGKRFRGSQLFGLDLSLNMLQRNRRASSLFSRNKVLQANAQAIPLKDGTVDVVIANLLLPWIADLPKLFHEIARVLRKDGLFAFAALGPESLRELRNAFQEDAPAHVREFADMHNVGDTL